MAFDGLVLKAVVSELDCLIGGKIQKIYEPTENEILLGIYSNGLQYALSINLSSNCYSVHLTTSKKENPLVAPNFCMLLRKHLMGYKISNIETFNLERILIIELTGKDDNNEITTKKLVVELMGKYSNILLLNNNNIIIDSLKHFFVDSGSSRNIMPKYSYSFPVSNKMDIKNYKDLENKFNDNGLIDFFANNFTGISKISIESAISCIIQNSPNVDSKLSKDILDNETYTILAEYFLKLLNDIENNAVKCIEFKDNNYALVSDYDISHLQINLFLDDYYFKKQEKEQFLSYRNTILNFIMAKLKKISKKLNEINDKLIECADMEKYKLYGELITSYLYQIPKKRLSHIELLNYYDENKLIDIPLDISIYPVDNAKKYFKKYNKLKATSSFVQVQKLELEKEIDYLESIVYEIESAETIKDVDEIYEEVKILFNNKSNKNKKKNKPKIAKSTSKVPLQTFISYQIENFKVLVGKNNRQNDELTFKIAKKEDIWFHVKDTHGSHVILMTNGQIPSQEIINKCAAIAAFYSKATYSSNVSVDYTFVKYVKKPKQVKPGMVIYTNQKTVNVQPKIETST